MERLSLVLAAVIAAAPIAPALAQHATNTKSPSARANGTLLHSAPCPANHVTGYDAYIASVRAGSPRDDRYE